MYRRVKRDADDADSDMPVVFMEETSTSEAECSPRHRGAIHQFLRIVLKLRILVLLHVSNLPYVVKVKNYSLIGE
jgi:hypothetical protein